MMMGRGENEHMFSEGKVYPTGRKMEEGCEALKNVKIFAKLRQNLWDFSGFFHDIHHIWGIYGIF